MDGNRRESASRPAEIAALTATDLFGAQRDDDAGTRRRASTSGPAPSDLPLSVQDGIFRTIQVEGQCHLRPPDADDHAAVTEG